MDTAGFKERMKQYKKAKGENPLLKYWNYMIKLASKKAKDWHDAEDFTLTRMLNDNLYNYEEFYNEDRDEAMKMLTADPEAHFTDAGKTVYHPTFSKESNYSSKVSDYNPRGTVGASWKGEDYYVNPSLILNGDFDYSKTRDYLNHAGGEDSKIFIPKYADGSYGIVPTDQSVKTDLSKLNKWYQARQATGRFEDLLGNGNLELLRKNRENVKYYESPKAYGTISYIKANPLVYDKNASEEEIQLKKVLRQQLAVKYGTATQLRLSNLNSNTKGEYNPVAKTMYLGTPDYAVHEYSHASLATPLENAIQNIIGGDNSQNTSYWYRPTEVHSRLMDYRINNDIDPFKVWNLDEIKQFKKSSTAKQYNLDLFTPEQTLDLFNNVASTNKNIERAADGSDDLKGNIEYDPKITSEGYDDKGYYAQAMNPLPNITIYGRKEKSTSERPFTKYLIDGQAPVYKLVSNIGAGFLSGEDPLLSLYTAGKVINKPLEYVADKALPLVLPKVVNRYTAIRDLNRMSKKFDGTVNERYFNNPNNWYRITETPEIYGILEAGKNITTRDLLDINIPSNNFRIDILNNNLISKEGYWYSIPKELNEVPIKIGSSHGNRSQASLGLMWGGSIASSYRFPKVILEGRAPSMIDASYNAVTKKPLSRRIFINQPYELLPTGTRVGFKTGDMPIENTKAFTRLPNGRYRMLDIVPDKRISYTSTNTEGYANGSEGIDPWSNVPLKSRLEKYDKLNPSWGYDASSFIAAGLTTAGIATRAKGPNEDENRWKAYLGLPYDKLYVPDSNIRFEEDYKYPNRQYTGLSKDAKDEIRKNIIPLSEFITNRYPEKKNKWLLVSNKKSNTVKNMAVIESTRLNHTGDLASYGIRENNDSGIYEVGDMYDFPWYIPVPNRNKGTELMVRDTIWSDKAKPERYIKRTKKTSLNNKKNK